MPIMPRNPRNKATRLAYKILGKPDNIKYKKSAFSRKIDAQLVSQETIRSK